MYRLPVIQEEFRSVVGWQQSYNPDEQIDSDLTQSESGLTFQGAHPLLTLENIQAVMPEQFQMRYPAWDALEDYQVDDIVMQNGKAYIATSDNINIDPEGTDFNEDYDDDFGGVWRVYNLLNDYLRVETDNALASVIQNFITGKTLSHQTKTLLERRTFFDGVGRLADTISNRNRLVGFEITPVRAMGVTTKIDRIGLQFTGGSATIRLWVFHSSLPDPVRFIDVVYDKPNGGFQWYNIKDLYLPYRTETNGNSGGAWFICYDQELLPLGMQAITVSKDWTADPCTTCGLSNVQAWRELTKYLKISPFTVTKPVENFYQNPTMWDVSASAYTNTLNYGLNVEVSVSCDLTDFMVSQKLLFANVIQKQVAIHFLKILAMNPSARVNRNQVNASMAEILYEIDGNADTKYKLGFELKKAYDALSLTTEGIDRVCLSCNRKGVKYTSV